MNNKKTEDWRIIAHEEFESRRSLEQKFAEVNSEYQNIKQALDATHKYNAIIAQKLSELERNNYISNTKLQRSMELLKKAKLLFAKHYAQINSLDTENKNLKATLAQKSAQLDAEVLQHQKTNERLVQTLSKLAANVAVTTYENLEALDNNVTEVIIDCDIETEEIFDNNVESIDDCESSQTEQKVTNFLKKILHNGKVEENFNPMQENVNSESQNEDAK